MPTYNGDYSKRKMAAVQAMVAEIQKIESLKKKGGKKLLAEYGYRGNQPKMALRGLRSFLLSEDNLFADFLSKFESGDLSPFKLAERVRQRTEKIGQNEVILHSDTIHHPEPLELGDGLTEMEPQELSDFLTEKWETQGKTYGDTRESVRGQSYTTRGHLNQATNPRGRYKATNEFSEPGRTEVSSHPRGANDPLMKAPDVKPRTRAEAKAFVETIEPLTEESVKLGAYADKDVRALADKKVTERGIIKPGDTLYRNDLPDETLKAAQLSLDNIDDEIDLAKAFKTPRSIRFENGLVRFNMFDPITSALQPLIKNPVGSVMGALFEGYNKETIQKAEQGNVKAAGTDIASGVVGGAAVEAGIKKVGLQKAASKVVPPLAGAALFNEGRPGSTTDYVVNKYGPKVGMNQNRPSWGTEIGEMNTQKPPMVQAVEDGIDYVANEAEYRAKQAWGGIKNFAGGVIFGF